MSMKFKALIVPQRKVTIERTLNSNENTCIKINNRKIRYHCTTDCRNTKNCVRLKFAKFYFIVSHMSFL